MEAFYCVVWNTADYHIESRWYFSCQELANYMNIAVRKKWDTQEVGMKLEAFAIAGCDAMSKFCNYSVVYPAP
jgi:hypothetical protein